MRSMRRIAGVLAAAGLIGLVAPTAGAAPSKAGGDAGSIPVNAQVARVVDGSTPVVEISKETYLAGATKAKGTLSATEREAIVAATSCWRWDAYRLGENVWGADLWKSHHRVNWCGDWSWIRTHAYTERWGETFWIGWGDKGITQQGSRYGVGWNQYQSWTQRKFCYVQYYACVQEANPYHNTSVFPNGAGQWN